MSVVAAVDQNLDEVPLEELEAEIVQVGSEISRLTARWLTALAEFDRRGAATAWGFKSTAEWLAWRCEIDLRTARDHMCAARRLAGLPVLSAALSAGDISFSKARTVARVADRDNETELLDLAKGSTVRQLEAAVRSMRAAPSANLDTANDAHERRYLETWWEEDGSLCFRGRVSADDGAALLAALESGCDAMTGATSAMAEGEDGAQLPPRGARMADALVEMALSGAPRAQVVVHVDPAALRCRAEEAEDREGEICALEDGPAVPSETARRLACDCDLALAHVRPDGSLDLGRTQRLPNAPLRKAVERRDQGCRFPGCGQRFSLRPHHIEHWIDGGPTDRENLVSLCRFHHRCVHEGGFTILRHGGRLRFVRPDGVLVPEVVAMAS